MFYNRRGGIKNLVWAKPRQYCSSSSIHQTSLQNGSLERPFTLRFFTGFNGSLVRKVTVTVKCEAQQASLSIMTILRAKNQVASRSEHLPQALKRELTDTMIRLQQRYHMTTGNTLCRWKRNICYAQYHVVTEIYDDNYMIDIASTRVAKQQVKPPNQPARAQEQGARCNAVQLAARLPRDGANFNTSSSCK
eukprot:g15248.t1